MAAILQSQTDNAIVDSYNSRGQDVCVKESVEEAGLDCGSVKTMQTYNASY
jgi:ERCC4-related helicase